MTFLKRTCFPLFRAAILPIILGFGLFGSRFSQAIPLMGHHSVARAGAGIAAINMHEVYTSNPGSMVGPRYYSVAGGFHSDGDTFQASVVDTKTSALAGALGYYHQTEGGRFEDPHWKTYGIQGALAGFLNTEFALGVTGKYIWYEQLPVGGQLAFPTEKDQALDIDVGAHYRFSSAVAVGLVFRDIFRSTHLEQFPLPNAAAGIALMPLSGLVVYGDTGRWLKTSPVKDEWQFAAGVDYQVMPQVVVRGGYRVVTNHTELQLLGVGMALTFDNIQLAYAGSFFLAASPLVDNHGISLTLMF